MTDGEGVTNFSTTGPGWADGKISERYRFSVPKGDLTSRNPYIRLKIIKKKYRFIIILMTKFLVNFNDYYLLYSFHDF